MGGSLRVADTSRRRWASGGSPNRGAAAAVAAAAAGRGRERERESAGLKRENGKIALPGGGGRVAVSLVSVTDKMGPLGSEALVLGPRNWAIGPTSLLSGLMR